MYYAYFGLSEPPFRITPNTEFFFSGGNRGAVLDALIYAITEGEGIIKVTGEVGSGKTMLCRMLQARLPERVETVYLANPNVSPDEILHAIAFEMQLPIARGASRLEVMQTLHQHLLDRHAAGRQVVVFVEESQSMPLPTLEEIRLLSNLETHDHKLLQIVLFGQPELDDNLSNQNIRQLRERIAHSFALPPLSARDVAEYLMFRLRAAGYRGPDLFGAREAAYLARATAGVTRRINLAADKALLAAFAENTHTIKLKHAKAAVRDSEFKAASRIPGRWVAVAVLLFAALSAAIAGGALYALYDARRKQAPSEENPALAAKPGDPMPAAAANAHPVRPAVGPVLAPNPEPAVSETPPPNPPSPESASSSSAPELAEDLLQSRLAATQEWLKTQSGSTFSIQLLGSDEPQKLRNRLREISSIIDIDQVHVYRTRARQQPSWTVLYGSYADRPTANAALAVLPAQLTAHRPLLRTIQGIRAEIGLPLLP